MKKLIVAVTVVLAVCVSTSILADEGKICQIPNAKIAFLSYGKLWLYDSQGPRMLSDLWEHRDVKWLNGTTLAVVYAGNIQLFDIQTRKRQQLTTVGNIRNILVLPDKKKIIFSRLTGNEAQCGWQHEICSVGITDKKITRIRKLWIAGDMVFEWIIIGDKVYYLDMIDADDQLVLPRSVLMQLDLSTARVKSLYTTKRGNNFLTVCRSWDQTKMMILGFEFRIHYVRDGDTTYQMYFRNSERHYIAQFKIPRLELAILHRFGQDFLKPEYDVGRGSGSCMLPDGRLVLGGRTYRKGNEGPEVSESVLYLFDFGTSDLTQIASGYRPNAISE